MNDGLLDRGDSFAADLKRQRTQQGMSQQELGEKISRSAQCIADFEAGVTRPQLETVHTLNEVLDGCNALGREIVDSAEGAPSVFFGLKDIPDDMLAAEVERRRLSGIVSE